MHSTVEKGDTSLQKEKTTHVTYQSSTSSTADGVARGSVFARSRRADSRQSSRHLRPNRQQRQNIRNGRACDFEQLHRQNLYIPAGSESCTAVRPFRLSRHPDRKS